MFTSLFKDLHKDFSKWHIPNNDKIYQHFTVDPLQCNGKGLSDTEK